MRRDFETPPYSQQLEVGKQGQLICHPPRGKPQPQVLGWLRNGVELDTKEDTNFIISSSGNLLILQAKLTDSANYSCVAGNVAKQRISSPALITVYSKLKHFYHSCCTGKCKILCFEGKRCIT